MSALMTPPLDHVVIDAKDQFDETAA